MAVTRCSPPILPWFSLLLSVYASALLLLSALLPLFRRILLVFMTPLATHGSESTFSCARRFGGDVGLDDAACYAWQPEHLLLHLHRSATQAPARERGGVACSSLSSSQRRPGREEAWPVRRPARSHHRCASGALPSVPRAVPQRALCQWWQ